MELKDVLGKRVLIKFGVLPREEQEQGITNPVFDRLAIVEVVGYNSDIPYQVIIDGKSLGWNGRVLRDSDMITRNAETYWFVNLNSIVEVLK